MKPGTKVSVIARILADGTYEREIMKFDQWMFNPHGVLKAVVIDKNGKPRIVFDSDIKVAPKWWEFWK